MDRTAAAPMTPAQFAEALTLARVGVSDFRQAAAAVRTASDLELLRDALYERLEAFVASERENTNVR